MGTCLLERTASDVYGESGKKFSFVCLKVLNLNFEKKERKSMFLCDVDAIKIHGVESSLLRNARRQ